MGFHISPCTGTNRASFISHWEKRQLACSCPELESKKGPGAGQEQSPQSWGHIPGRRQT